MQQDLNPVGEKGSSSLSKHEAVGRPGAFQHTAACCCCAAAAAAAAAVARNQEHQGNGGAPGNAEGKGAVSMRLRSAHASAMHHYSVERMQLRFGPPSPLLAGHR
eukprot:scaffold64001_cov20-Tisochrysis_lutea.AAC.1